MAKVKTIKKSFKRNEKPLKKSNLAISPKGKSIKETKNNIFINKSMVDLLLNIILYEFENFDR